MDYGGGFIPPDAASVAASDQATAVEDDLEPIDVRPLTKPQERRLVEYLETHLLDINRGFKKRYDPSTHLPHLLSYLEATQPIVSLILRIPPVAPSASLRVTYLLRITGEMLDAIPSYPLVVPREGSDDPSLEDTLVALLDSITLLDKGWLAVLQSEAWDPGAGRGRPSNNATSGPSQTDKTRLRSIILQGKEQFEEWIRGGQVPIDDEVSDEFASVFWRTLEALGDVGPMVGEELLVDEDPGVDDEHEPVYAPDDSDDEFTEVA